MKKKHYHQVGEYYLQVKDGEEKHAMTDRFEYYVLEDETKLRRLKVPGGWLVDVGGYRESSACFYPDPTHCWEVGKTDPDHTCTKCGSNDLRKSTEFNRAFCHIQYGINTNLFCYDCQSESVRRRLDNPIKSCDECEGTSTCPNSQAAFDAVKKNYRPRQEEMGKGSGGKGTSKGSGWNKGISKSTVPKSSGKGSK